MKLVFYGGGDSKDNVPVDKSLIRMIDKKSPLFTYIPSSSIDSDIEFVEFVKQYKKYKVKRFLTYPLDTLSDDVLTEQVFKSDVIHLGGGNTYYFLKTLRKRKLMGELKKFVKRGGILTGLSAGAILMTPRIHTASFPEHDRDENDCNIKNFNSLNLVDFEFFPHYKNSKRYDLDLRRHSENNQNPIYACYDGSAVIVDKGDLKFVGRVYMFYQGRKLKIN